MSPDRLIPILLTLAWLAPLAGTVAVWIVGKLAIDHHSRRPAWIAVGSMVVSLNLVLIAGGFWWRAAANLPAYSLFGPLSGTFYTLGEFGGLTLSLDYYIDSLTVLMFAVVTFIATCVHVYAIAYLGHDTDELSRDHRESSLPRAANETPHHSSLTSHLPRFFALLQFFTFSMLGLVLAGNLLQVFIFWELVGAASYFLIGFYFERAYAAAAATKAFVMNRIGDAGFLIGIMILWTAFGTLTFGTGHVSTLNGQFVETYAVGLLSADLDGFFGTAPPRWWLVLAGLCLFAGCVGKSAQLPLSTWLPDAMAGPTPVSALVHSATMVAAGVYLVGRVYPLFLPEVLLVIAYVGAITLVYGATCAVVQTDLKRILAYSTVSQLGYMMLALGVGGREAGLFHLVTHAFFKSLLFLAAGSVIIACHHVQDVSRLGGLRKRMPFTAYTSLVGVIAIGGLAVPVVTLFGEAIALSGYHSKDSILASSLAFARLHPEHGLLFALPLVTAGLTAFYMFRFWLLAFAGEPRDETLHRHVKESSPLMTVPLVLLAIFAAFSAIGGEAGPLYGLIEASRPANAAPPAWPSEAFIDAHHTASLWGLLAGTIGAAAALAAYGAGLLDARRGVAFFGPIRTFFGEGWQLDALYRTLIIKPLELISFVASLFDRFVIDGLLHGVSHVTLAMARFDRTIDERIVDGIVNRLADATYATGRSFTYLQSGRIRQYVMALAAAAVVLFALTIVLVSRMT